jgi:hypothetical protein
VLSPKSFFQERSSQKPSAYANAIYAWELQDLTLVPMILHISKYTMHNNVNSPPPQGRLNMLKQPDEKQDIE